MRFRVDGTLHTSIILPPNVYNGIVARIKILAKLRLDEKENLKMELLVLTLMGIKLIFVFLLCLLIMVKK